MFNRKKKQLAEQQGEITQLKESLSTLKTELQTVQNQAGNDGNMLSNLDSMAEIFGVSGRTTGPSVTAKTSMKVSVVFKSTVFALLVWRLLTWPLQRLCLAWPI